MKLTKAEMERSRDCYRGMYQELKDEIVRKADPDGCITLAHEDVKDLLSELTRSDELIALRKEIERLKADAVRNEEMADMARLVIALVRGGTVMATQ